MGTPYILTLLPCPFCGGPPVASVFNEHGVILDPDKIHPEGSFYDAHVWCHECGAQGSDAREFVYDKETYYDLELAGAKLWNERGDKNAMLYSKKRARYPDQGPCLGTRT